MKFRKLALVSSLLLSAATVFGQTGYTLKTYPALSETQFRVADFNHDGRADLFGFSPGLNTGDVYLNDGNGGFKAPVTLSGNGYIQSARIADMNGDGNPDIVACYVNYGRSATVGTVQIFLNDGAGNFTVSQSLTLSNSCAALVVGDVNLDGHQDVVIGTSVVPNNIFMNLFQTFYGDGTGKLSTTPVTQQNVVLDAPSAGTAYTNCALTDMTGGNFFLDGQFSLLANSTCYGPNETNQGNLPGTTFLARGEGNGQFLLSQSHTQAESVSDAVTADVNSDGRPDATFFSVNNTPPASNLYYGQNNGSGSLAYSILNSNIAAGGGPAPVQFTGDAVADLNGDGINDLAAVYYTAGANPSVPAMPYISILNGSKTGTLTESQHFLIDANAFYVSDIAAGDFNGDGKQDLAVIVRVFTSHTTSSTLLYVYNSGTTSTACAAPTTTNKNVICTPAAGATVASSPVTVTAASNVPNLTLNRLYLDNTAVYQTASATVNTTITASNGAHTLVLVSYNNAGAAFSTTNTFTIPAGTGGGGCLPASGPGVSICSPVAGSTNPSSPSTITLNAGAIAQTGNITAIRAYVDNVSVLTVNNSATTNSFQVDSPINVAAGTHNLVVVGYESTGGSVSGSETFTVTAAGPCVPPSGQQGVAICSPGTGTTASPVTVRAGAYQANGNIASIRIYVDNVAQATVQNPKASSTFATSQSIPVTSGKHNLVVVAYPAGGGSFSANETITVQ